MIRLLESKPFLFFFRIICGRLWGSLAIEDHLRSILGIICGTVQNSVATTSLEFKHLYRKSRCEMLIGGDDISNDVITLDTCFSMFVYSRADWRKSESSVALKFQRRSWKKRPGELDPKLMIRQK